MSVAHAMMVSIEDRLTSLERKAHEPYDFSRLLRRLERLENLPLILRDVAKTCQDSTSVGDALRRVADKLEGK